MAWWNRLSLQSRLIGLLAVLVLRTSGGGLTTFWYTGYMRDLFTSMIDRDLVALQTAEELEISLVSQKGLVTYYFLNGDPDWLKQLEEQQDAFEAWLHKAQEQTGTRSSRESLDQIAEAYIEYVGLRNQVIALYKNGEREQGADLHWTLRSRFSAIYTLCEQYKAFHNKEIANTRSWSLARARQFNTVALVAMLFVLLLSGLLVVVLITQIIKPIQRLTRVASMHGDSDEAGHEVMALSQSVHGLIEDVGHTRTELERSKERLLHSEKMALIGKLAAEMAHSIRNPLTSIKMRLFSLERGLGLNSAQKEDLEVVSGEMRRLDHIVCNFLEFSRPPKLEIQEVNINEIMTMSLQLLEKRFERRKIEVEHSSTSKALPPIKGDPELLKEVLINLMDNACDAMGEGGRLIVKVDEGVAEQIGRAVLVSISDTGPGIPDSIKAKVMEPFFTTKGEGTGLGLSIARRIVEEHGGRIAIRSKAGEGAAFIITLPVPEEER